MLHALPGQMEWVHFPAFSPDGQMLAAANREGGVTIWDANSDQELLAFDGDGPTLTAITFSPDGTKLAAGGQEGIVHIWDALSGERLTDIRTDGDTITELIFTSNGDIIRSFDQKGTIVAWDVATGARLGGLHCPNRIQIDAELTKDGQLSAVACNSVFVVRPQDAPNRETVLYSLAQHFGEATGVAFNPEGTILAISTSVGVIKLWDMETGEERQTLSRSGPPLGGVDFSPDGRYLVTAASDGTISVYIMSIDELMDVARSRLSRDFTGGECQTYLSLPSCPEE